MTVGRVIGWLITLTLIAFGLLWPVVFTDEPEPGTPPSDPVWFSEYQAEYAVDADGTMRAVETITAEFPTPSDRRGLFKFWDVVNPNAPGARQIPTDIEVLLDDRPTPVRYSWENGNRFFVAKIGDPDRTISGTHVFQIRYTIAGVLDPGDSQAPSTFYWNVVAGGWNNEIVRAGISVQLPNVVDVECIVGFGSGRPCRELTVDEAMVRISAEDLPPRTPVTVRVGVDVPTPERATLPWSYQLDRVFGYSTTGVMTVLALTVGAAVLAWWWSLTTREKPPGFPVQYAPPDGLGPVQTEYIRTEAVTVHGLAATLYHLAERGLISLAQVSDKKWTIRGIAEPGRWASVDPVSIAVGSALKVMHAGREFDANGSATAGTTLSKAKTDMSAAVQKWALDDALLVKRPRELWIRWVNALALILAVFAFCRWGFDATMWGLPFAGFFLFTCPGWRSGVGLRRTQEGRELWSRAGGFHRLIATDSAESRFDFGARQDLYSAYVPYAVAAGTAALWARKYQSVTGAPPPQPGWYSSTTGTHVALAGSSGGFESFESAVSSSISAYTAAQSSSSSGSSSGGSSSSSGGGGGGGGGGGSW